MSTQSSSYAIPATEALASLRPKLSTYVKMRQALLSNPSMLGGLIIVLFFGLIAITAPLITRDNWSELDLINRLQSPNSEHWFGTGPLGRDIYGMIVYGSRVSLTVGAAVAFFSATIGIFIGITAGYFRKLDNVIMRFMDGIMAIPGILLAIALMSLLGGNLFNVIIAITVVDTPRTARVVRSAVLSIREQMYIDAAKAYGAQPARILYRHVLPNTFAPVIIQATFLFATAILIEASLSFLGAGIPITTPSWGNIIGDSRDFALKAPWIVFFPSVALFLVAMAVNLFGDGLRDKLDPKLRGKN